MTKELQASIDRALIRFAGFNDCAKVERSDHDRLMEMFV